MASTEKNKAKLTPLVAVIGVIWIAVLLSVADLPM